MTDRVLVSAVIVTGEHFHSLLDSIDSALAWTSQVREVIVVVDPQNTAVFAISCQAASEDPRVRVVELEPSRGRGGAINAGIESAQGEYLIFLEADEVVGPVVLDASLAMMESSGSDLLAAVSGSRARLRDRVEYLRGGFHHSAVGITLADRPGLIEDDNVSTKIFRRRFLLERRIRAIEGTDTGDARWIASALLQAKAIDVSNLPLVWRNKASVAVKPATWYRGRLAESQTVLEEIAASAPAVARGYARVLMRRDVLSRPMLQAIESGDLSVEASRLMHEIGRHIEIDDVVDLRVEDRWKLAIVSAGQPELLTLLRSPDPDAVVEDGDHLGVPNAIERSLGLGGDSLLRAFERRFISRGDHTTNPGRVRERYEGDPEISVIVPVHNVGRFVDELLLSIRANIDVKVEIIVVDDSSTDDTWDRVQRHAVDDERVHAHRSVGRGGGQARNHGVELARGEYIAFADGDDLVPPRAYTTMLTAARQTDAEIVSGPYLKLFTTSTWDTRSSFASLYSTEMSATDLHALPQLTRHRAIWNRLFRRDFWVENAFPFPGVPRSNDIVPFMSALTVASRVSVVPDVVYVYRDRPGMGSMTSGAGTDAYTLSYFSEELTCAQLLRQRGALPIEHEYWDMVLNADGWGNLTRYLETAAASDESSRRVSEVVDRLLALVPEDDFSAMDAERQAIWRLVAISDFESARVLARGLKGARQVPFLDVFEAIVSATDIDNLLNRTKSELVRKYVLRRVIDDSDMRQPENLVLTIPFLHSLANHPGLVLAVPPDSCEDRLWRASKRGNRSAISRALKAVPPHPVAELNSSRNGTFITGPKHPLAVRYKRVVATRKIDGSVERYSVGAARAVSDHDRWQAEIDLTHLPQHGRWTLHVEYVDSWGPRRTSLPMVSEERKSGLRRDPQVSVVSQEGADVVTRSVPRLGWTRGGRQG